MNFSKQIEKIPAVLKVAEAGKELKLDSYLVGGFPRDLLLERQNVDLDFLCVGDGIVFAEAVAKKYNPKKKVSIFKKYGTAHFRDGKHDLEFVGARKESYSSNSRKPEVSPGTLQDDLNRRDFTINALAIKLSPNDDFGALLDPFDGLGDLKRKLIRTPTDPDITFSDDPLRMLRAIRFASQLKFDIDPDTFAAIERNSERLKIISGERIIDELNKIILSEKPSYGFQLLFSSGLLKIFFPEMVALQGVEVIDKKGHKDNFYHTLKVLDNVADMSSDLWLRWAAILHDIAKPPTKRFNKRVGWTFHGHEDKGARMVPGIFRRLKLPMDERMRFVQKLVKLHLRPIPLVRNDITDSALRRLLFDAGDDIEALLSLCRADITSKNEKKVKTFLKNLDIVEKKLGEIEEKDKLRNFQPPIRGEEIMDLFGLKPGPEIGKLKTELKDAILDGVIENDHQQALNYVIRLGESQGLKLKKP